MHEAIRSVRQLEAMNAELTARLRLADEQAHSLLPLQEESARLKREASGARERVVLLEVEIRWLKAQVFGRSAEHHAPDTASDQQMLFNEPEVLAALEAAEAALPNALPRSRPMSASAPAAR